MKRRPDVILLVLALSGGILAFSPAPRSEPQPVDGIPVSVTAIPGAAPSRALAATGTSVAVRSGASESKAVERRAASAATTLPGPRPTAPKATPAPRSKRPVAATKPRGTARPLSAGTAVVRQGLASTYGPRFSEHWVALPDGPGWRFRVCGAGGCRELVSTDAGPDRAMQRQGRIVDLPVGAFEDVCGVPWTMGLCNVTVTILGRAS